MPDSEPAIGARSTTSSGYSPETSASATVFVQGDRIDITLSSNQRLWVTFGRRDVEGLEIAVPDVTRWCAETSVLMRVTFELASGDEVAVRAPMLLDRRGVALAVVRQITCAGSRHSIAI